MIVRVIALVVGLALLLGGIAWVSVPAACAVAGVFLCAFALLTDDGSNRE